jgi:hypothetical protein
LALDKNLNRFVLCDGNLGLVVAADEELHEQKEVASVHDESSSIVFLLDFARLVGIVKVESQKSDNDTNHHLRNLKACDDYRIEPLRTKFHCHQKVVPIHGRMNAIVHDNKENTWRRGCDIGMPAK